MPEGPEVTTIKDGLNRLLKNKTLVSITFPEGSKFLKKTPPQYNEFNKNLPIKIKEVKSKGKLIYFVFENGWYMLSRLLLSGGWYLEKAPKHNHCELVYKTNDTTTSTKSIWFVDPRHFATLVFTNDQKIMDTVLNDIGPDLLNDTIKEDMYMSVMKNKKNGKKTIATVMMDQSVFSGVGNYLKSEILYSAKVSPHSIINNIPDNKLLEIFHITLEKIKASYKMGGASVRNYSDIKGQDGTFSFTFAVYHMKKDPHGNKVITEKTKDGRTTHWVKEIQIQY
jgi:DNA-formamidopyrimidine glycosylase